MDCSYQLFSMPHDGKQQPQAYHQTPPKIWLARQPHDSVYAGGEDDFFAYAFRSSEEDMNIAKNGETQSPSNPASPYSSSYISSHLEHEDSLVVPSENWLPYETTFYKDHLDSSTRDMSSQLPIPTPMYFAAWDHVQQAGHNNPHESEMAQCPVMKPSLMEDSYYAPEPVAEQLRQRKHHAAVEQRYRKNLNQQYINLRLAVPNIQAMQPQRAGQLAKPSKSEVLAGAVDYIELLEEENRSLKGLSEGALDESRKRIRTMR